MNHFFPFLPMVFLTAFALGDADLRFTGFGEGVLLFGGTTDLRRFIAAGEGGLALGFGDTDLRFFGEGEGDLGFGLGDADLRFVAFGFGDTDLRFIAFAFGDADLRFIALPGFAFFSGDFAGDFGLTFIAFAAFFIPRVSFGDDDLRAREDTGEPPLPGEASFGGVAPALCASHLRHICFRELGDLGWAELLVRGVGSRRSALPLLRVRGAVPGLFSRCSGLPAFAEPGDAAGLSGGSVPLGEDGRRLGVRGTPVSSTGVPLLRVFLVVGVSSGVGLLGFSRCGVLALASFFAVAFALGFGELLFGDPATRPSIRAASRIGEIALASFLAVAFALADGNAGTSAVAGPAPPGRDFLRLLLAALSPSLLGLSAFGSLGGLLRFASAFSNSASFFAGIGPSTRPCTCSFCASPDLAACCTQKAPP